MNIRGNHGRVSQKEIFHHRKSKIAEKRKRWQEDKDNMIDIYLLDIFYMCFIVNWLPITICTTGTGTLIRACPFFYNLTRDSREVAVKIQQIQKI
jgi:hypothetical protein